MNRLLPSELWLQPDLPSAGRLPARSRIFSNGRDSGCVVDGLVLEAAIRWKNCTLLFLTDDTPFEDFLRIYLFDARWKLLDRVAMGAMYSTGIFSNLELIPPNNVQFRFFSGSSWKLELLDAAVCSLPFAAPRGVVRPFGFRKRFALIELPLP